MIYAFKKRLWKKRNLEKGQGTAVLNGIAVLFLSTRFHINSPLKTILTASASDFKRVRYFNVKYKKYLFHFRGRSPPSVLVFLY
ncbi:MAG: hypothetical protein APF77_18505 [Clostridia bacterium BRH_c25]|nr:MAG: hypothetical protein APF77_18505 [Clostridia bacterium BRH_c25]